MTQSYDAERTDPRSRELIVSMSPEISASYPECRTVFLLAQGIKNNEPWPDTEEALTALEADVREGRRHLPTEDEAAISVWHDLLRSFGTNPRRARPSIDALSRRLQRSGRLPRVSSLVDTCNLVSLSHLLPTGGFDLAAFRTGIELRRSRPDDVYVPLGEPDKTERPLEGEVIYADGSQVMTRHWNHRDSDVTKVTAATRDAVLLLEGVSPVISAGTLLKARAELAERVAPHCERVSLHEIDPAEPLRLVWEPTS
ncbi:B3/4 domain-containing protein [Streptomyces sp. NPDC048523]|uniref:B3/B4 domain-containing protein n=1 Tax=Streptomyces sp. NPDC048523 TaxID=3365567 RepID=UPI003712C15D